MLSGCTESLLVNAGYTEEALEIWVQQGKWEHAFQAASHLGPDIVSDLCLRCVQLWHVSGRQVQTGLTSYM